MDARTRTTKSGVWPAKSVGLFGSVGPIDSYRGSRHAIHMSSDEIVAVLALLGIVAAVAYRAYLKHKPAIDEILEDGLSLDDLDDIKELAEDAKEDIEEVVNLVSSLPKTKTELKGLKKNELVALAEEHNLDIEGTKADLVERLLPLL